MYYSAGLSKRQIAELCTKIETSKLEPGMRQWPPILGLHDSLTATLKYLRRNRVQADIAEDYSVSQPTISRAISAITPLLLQALLECIPTADDLDEDAQYFVDGTLLPCWSWKAHPGLYGQSGVLDPMDPRNWIADKGYVGNGMITPFKKPAGGELLEWQKEYNKAINKVRYVIEQVIAHFKTWRIMDTDYRRPIETFPETISAVIGLHFYKMTE